MKKLLGVSAVTAVALALSVPAFAGGDHCGGAKSTTMASAYKHTKSAAWAGAWLQRTSAGTVKVAEVAKGSAASRAGLKPGDVVLAVNGYDLADSEQRAMCASKAACKVGSEVTYTVKRGDATQQIAFKLEKMPAKATERFASRQAQFDPVLAAVVMPEVN